MITVSAHSPNALRRNAAMLADALERPTTTTVSRRSATPPTGSRAPSNTASLRPVRVPNSSALSGAMMTSAPIEEPSLGRPGRLRVGLLCTGQGAQYPGMTQGALPSLPALPGTPGPRGRRYRHNSRRLGWPARPDVLRRLRYSRDPVRSAGAVRRVVCPRRGAARTRGGADFLWATASASSLPRCSPRY